MDDPVEARIYPCQEHGEVSVPITELIVEGRVDVFREYKQSSSTLCPAGKIVLTSKIMSDCSLQSRVSIHVIPKVPIGNILYIIHRAKQDLRYIPRYVRGYRLQPLDTDSAEELFASALIDCLIGLERHGLLRCYVERTTERGWRGASSSRGRSSGTSPGATIYQTRQYHELSSDIPENQILKETVTRVIRRLSTLPDAKARSLVQKAIPASRLLDGISEFNDSLPGAARLILNCIRRIPASHRFYERSLWLCYFIATRQGICLESFGPARIESVVVNIADVFEDFVRNVVVDNIESILPGSRVRDGNRNMVPLFVQAPNIRWLLTCTL